MVHPVQNDYCSSIGIDFARNQFRSSRCSHSAQGSPTGSRWGGRVILVKIAKKLFCFECGSPPKTARATPLRSAPLGLMHARQACARAPDLCTGVGRMHACRTYVPAPDLCTGAGLRHGRRAYVQAPELCTGAWLVHRAPHLRRGAGLVQRRRTYARAPDLCAGAGLVRGRRNCGRAPEMN